eukprot:9635224-Heterocapsa_arctica.AAC.1
MKLMKENRDLKKPDGTAEANQESDKGALVTDMSMEEERTIIDWIDSNPWVKESALLEDESMLKMTDTLSNGLES